MHNIAETIYSMDYNRGGGARGGAVLTKGADSFGPNLIKNLYKVSRGRGGGGLGPVSLSRRIGLYLRTKIPLKQYQQISEKLLIVTSRRRARTVLVRETGP